jgi:8-oxo-dGTP pyrophosphatase MutT (NUDIX family)
MYRPFGKSELQTRYEESLNKHPPTQVRAPKRQSPPLNGRLAAVAFLIGQSENGEMHFLITRRAAHLEHHPAQVALPGGMLEDFDDGDLRKTLRREVFEEVGLPEEKVEWVESPWDSMISIQGTEVFPFVGFLKVPMNECELKIDQKEVESAEWLPMRHLFDEQLWTRKEFDTFSSRGPVESPVWTGWKYDLWGLTAALLSIFINRVSGRAPFQSLI